MYLRPRVSNSQEPRAWSMMTGSSPGSGSMFHVTAPYGDAPAALPRAVPRSASEQRLSQALVLVIDNEPSILAGMTAMLGGWNCRVCVAASGDAALALLPTLP